jgi:hypothetical protein
VERLGRDHDRHREGAAGKPLAVGAAAGVSDHRRVGNLVAECAAQATAGRESFIASLQ